MRELITKKYLDLLTYRILGAAIEVHKAIGPGLLESVYHKCLKYELTVRKINYNSEISIPVKYKNMNLDAELRCDLLVEEIIAIELKAVETILPVHEAQIFTYMKMLDVPKGILINFNSVNLFREGQRTFVNEIFRKLPDA